MPGSSDRLHQLFILRFIPRCGFREFRCRVLLGVHTDPTARGVRVCPHTHREYQHIGVVALQDLRGTGEQFSHLVLIRRLVKCHVPALPEVSQSDVQCTGQCIERSDEEAEQKAPILYNDNTGSNTDLFQASRSANSAAVNCQTIVSRGAPVGVSVFRSSVVVCRNPSRSGIAALRAFLGSHRISIHSAPRLTIPTRTNAFVASVTNPCPV